MEEANSFDLLIKNLSKRGLTCESNRSERKIIIPGSGWSPSAKLVVAPVGSLYFCATDSFANTAFTSVINTGIYGIIKLTDNVECMIYKKYWLDTFLRTKKIKTGNSFIDDRLTVTSDSSWNPSGLLTDSDVKLFLEIDKQIVPCKIVVQNNYLPFIDTMKGKTIIGIESNQWLYQDKDLDILLNLGIQLIENVISRKSKTKNY